MKRRLAILFWASAASSAILSDQMVARLRKVNDAIYNQQYAQAEALCRAMIDEAPGDPAGYAYLARSYWSEQLNDTRALSIERFTAADLFTNANKLFARVDPQAEQRFRDAVEQARNKADARLRAQPEDLPARFFLGVAYQTLASWDLSLRGAYLDSAKAGDKAYHLHESLLRADANFADALLTTGAYEYGVASLPFKVRWLALLLGYPANRDRGRRNLELAAEKALVAGDDARTLLSVIYAREGRFDLAYRKLEELAAKFPKNPLLRLEMASLDMRMDNPAGALAIYQGLLRQKWPRLETATVRTRIGVAYRAMRRFNESADELRRAIDDAQRGPARLKTAARLELGKTFDLAGRREEAVQQYRETLASEDFGDAHREATRLLRHPYDGT